MNQSVKLKQPKLRVAHQSEVLQLRRALTELQTEIKEIKSAMNQPTPHNLKKIILLSNGKHNYVSLDDIIYCEAEGNYTKVHIREIHNKSGTCSTRTLFVSKSLKTVTDLISSSSFIRCHQSYLVNIKHVVGCESKSGFHLNLSDSTQIPVSRRNKKMVMEMYSRV